MEKALLTSEKDLTVGLKSFYKNQFEHIRKLHALRAGSMNSMSGRALARRRSKVLDDLIVNYLSYSGNNELKGISVVALGSYGRNELCPYSDVDLMFLYDEKRRKNVKKIAENLFYKLWDLKIDLGHATRTIKECIELSYDTDTTILTSILDSRLICGDEKFYKLFVDKLYKDVLPNISRRFIDSKVTENNNRLEKYGKSIYLLEPNVKEGLGGIRDINYALWISQAKFKVKRFRDLLIKGVLFENELNTFRKNLNFLLTIRSELHYLAGTAENSIRMDFQQNLATYFGFKDSDINAVEKFMRIYYLRANQTTEYAERLIERCLVNPVSVLKNSKIVNIDKGFVLQNKKLSVRNRNIIKNNPENMIFAYVIADNFGCEFSNYLSDLIREHSNVIKINDEFRKDPTINETFIKLLQSGKNVSKILFEMNRVRFLGHFIPEFGKIVCMAQYDAYHVYTVDIHSIFMVKEIEKLLNDELSEEFPLITNLAKELKKRYLLYLACLFHDMGKGEGKNHSQKGAAMISRISKRMGLSTQDAEVLEFMVKHHLIMPHFSQRRDLNDASLIIRFARSVRTKETLTILYLLTFADMRSVGPDTWSDWKGMLLEQLYLKTQSILEQGEFEKEIPSKRRSRFIDEVSFMLRKEISHKSVSNILNKMPDSYFYGFSPQTICRHIRLIKKAGRREDFHVSFHPSLKFDEFIFWGFDNPGVFYKLCGVLSANGINILGARITSRNDGRILDVFYVNKLNDSTVNMQVIWSNARKNLEMVLGGEIKARDLLKKRNSDYTYRKKNYPLRPSRIEIDNESSDQFTVIDYYSNDRIGLLYEVSRTLNKLGLSINYAKISTKVDQVSDVFYVVDSKGKKIHNPNKLKKIKDTLLSLDSR